ncbi:lysoplasmalogenase [Endozoicomonas arenosclerae]|uniref:lysoplasmalogenase n=1 Tax=Endozoicomonas arenosclerae TaxID=1633495 RepID=UPI000781C720|nr:lysoplasmalogenase [Endozoicomonas arenosclerae]
MLILRIALGCSALGYLIFMDSLSGLTGAFLKALPVFLLMALVVLKAEPKWKPGLLMALLFSAGGDLALALPEYLDQSFMVGLGSFLIAQLTYATLFWRHRVMNGSRNRYAFAFLPVAACVALVVVPFSGSMMGPVVIYLLAISFMVVGAALCHKPLGWLFLGALTFALSDTLLAINKFVVALPAAGLLVMLTYYCAQILIIEGALKERSSH